MPWRCDQCGTIHTQNPKTCRNCENTNFQPIGSAELEDQSVGIESPTPMDKNDIETYSGAIDSGGDESPDLNPDGSIKKEQTTSISHESPNRENNSLIRSLYFKIRAIVLAPIKLLWSYIIPVVAFALVFGLIIWLMISMV